MRTVLAGCGRMSTAWLEAARQIDDLDIAGLVDIDPSAAERQAAAQDLRGVAIGDDLSAMLRRTQARIVFDVAVPEARPGVAAAAFEAGCHLLTEKPMAPSMDQARALVASARDAGRVHAVVQNRRYHPGVRRLSRFLRSGAIGDIAALHCDFFLAPRFGGFRETMRHVLLLDMAIHTFDVGRLLAGAAAEAVYCREWNPTNSWYARDASAVAVFEMQGGAVFTYRGSWCAEGLPTSWESTWRIIGTRGSVLWDGANDMRCEVQCGGAEREGLFAAVEQVEIPPLDPRDRVGGHLGVMRDFVAAVQGGPPPETAGEENIKSLAMVFSAIESADQGARVVVA